MMKLTSLYGWLNCSHNFVSTDACASSKHAKIESYNYNNESCNSKS